MSVDLIRSMFAIIDACSWHELPTVFDADCVYERPGFPDIQGIDALIDFYRDIRPIRIGVHTISDWIVERDRICASGDFVGTLRDGTEVRLRFTDLYALSNQRVLHRRTFFFTPLV